VTAARKSTWIAAARPGPRILVLAYHSISDAWSDPLAVHPTAFAGQVHALANRGYRGVTFGEAARAEAHVGEPLIAITFDDAFATVRSARKILEEVGWPATVFVPTVAVDTGAPMRWLLRDRWMPDDDAHLSPLTWEDLAELRDVGWEIGSHSRTHPLLSSLDDAAAYEELCGSRAEIEERLGPCSSISYPWGELDDRIIALAREAGYANGSGLVGGRDGDPFAVARFAIAAGDGTIAYALKTSAAFWRFRGSLPWRALDHVRHPAGRAWPSADDRARRAALIVDGNTGPSLAVVRSLGRQGWRIVAPAGSRAARSRFTNQVVDLADAVQEPQAFEAGLARLVDQVPLDVVIPSTDASLEACWRVVGERDQPHILGGDARTVRMTLDKVECLRVAEKHGFPVPVWFAPDSAREALDVVGALGTPFVVKPRRSFVTIGSVLHHRRHVILRGHEDLEAVMSALAEPTGELPVLQQYVPGRSLSVSAVVHGGQVIGSVARETFTFHPVAGGTSVWKRTIDPGDVGVAEALRLLCDIGLEGLAEAEYQVGADGSPRLMEIGARVHGWIPLAMVAGVDLPLLAAQAAIGQDVRPAPPYRVGVEMRWPAGELLRLRAALGPRSSLPPDVKRRTVVAGLWPPWRPGMRYDGIDFTDPRPWITRPRSLRRRD
jgi:peptidoglycan/xylan/chitin deacetylase (PgdA/CDA1 family)/glutathione synthase/RimK-type ligase-like ATP-grasp enzyme